jgi:hypothetical protein
MLVYRCKSRFFCSPLKEYIPEGATIARYENAIRLVINFDPNGLVVLDTILRDGICYEDPKYVQWFYKVEPPPNGTFAGGLFEYVASEYEDAYGNVGLGTLPSTHGIKGITVGESTVTVSGVSFGMTPTGIVVSVSKPDDGYNIFATVIQSSITSSGFTVKLSAPVPDIGYYLTYFVF